MEIGLYVHIPYCRFKCPYCDFNVQVMRQWPEEQYVAALTSELRHAAAHPPWRGRTVRTVFFGGGTPSLFAPAASARILSVIRASWPVAPELEVTLEANPDRTGRDSLASLRAAGVTRLSLGIQSFTAAQLTRLGRKHRPQDCLAAVRAARAAGFDNVNLDLLYAVPGQTIDEWESDLRTACNLRPEHVSTYALTYEEGTLFHRRRTRGELVPPPEEVEAAMWMAAAELLSRAGYERYEISNHARPGHRCRHNVNTWNGTDYLGVGAGAHSYCSTGWGERWSNERRPARYMAAIAERGEAQAFRERLTRAQAMAEWAFLHLRQAEGVEHRDFHRRFGCDLEVQFTQVRDLCTRGLLAPTARGYRLTAKGALVADAVAATFF